MLVIGIDPGSIYTGYGLVDKEGSSLAHIASGRIHTGGSKNPLPERLEIIYEGLSAIMEEYRPEAAAIEAIYSARYPKSALVLGHARGAALLALNHTELEIHEYPPSSVKQSVTGKGNASKDQVQYMVRLTLQIETPLAEDAADALAVAICHAQSMNFHDRLDR